MDIARPSVAGQRRRRQIIYAGVGIVLVALVTMGLSRLKPAAPTVERSTVWVDTVKRGRDGQIVETVDRAGLWRAQTPQAFHYRAILDAHRAASGFDLSDDAAVAERSGLSVGIALGDENNFKITTEADLATAERLLSTTLADVRTGEILYQYNTDAVCKAPLPPCATYSVICLRMRGSQNLRRWSATPAMASSLG